MNKPRLILGIVSLVLALIILILSFALPLDSPYFYAGEANFRWVGAVVLAILGIYLLATANRVGKAK